MPPQNTVHASTDRIEKVAKRVAKEVMMDHVHDCSGLASALRAVEKQTATLEAIQAENNNAHAEIRETLIKGDYRFREIKAQQDLDREAADETKARLNAYENGARQGLAKVLVQLVPYLLSGLLAIGLIYQVLRSDATPSKSGSTPTIGRNP